MENVNDIPMPLALLCCDTIITDAATAKKTLVGIFNSVKVSRFPHIIPQFFVFASITNAEGEIPISVRLCSSDGTEVFNLPGKLPCKTLLDSPEMVFQIQNLPIREEGVYCLELLAAGNVVAARNITVKLVPLSK